MAQVTGMSADRMIEIENASIVNGEVDPATGSLILTRFDGTEINAGVVSRSILVVTSATRPSPATEGMVIYETDTDRLYSYDGTAWVYRGGTIICTSTTRPANPFEGLKIYETNTDDTLIYTGSAWRRVIRNNQVTIAGTHADSVASGAAGETITVSFGVTFAAAPIVVATLEVSNNNGFVWQIIDGSITTSQFQFRLLTRDGGVLGSAQAYDVNWVAVGQLAGA